MNDSKKYPVLPAGPHVGELVYVEREEKDVMNWQTKEKERKEQICFRYRVEVPGAEQTALVFRDVNPYFKAEKGNLAKDLTGLSGGALPNFTSDETGLEWLQEQKGKKFLVTVKNFQKRNGDQGHGFVSVSAIPAGFAELTKPLEIMASQEASSNHPKPADDVTFDDDDIPF